MTNGNTWKPSAIWVKRPHPRRGGKSTTRSCDSEQGLTNRGRRENGYAGNCVRTPVPPCLRHLFSFYKFLGCLRSLFGSTSTNLCVTPFDIGRSEHWLALRRGGDDRRCSLSPEYYVSREFLQLFRPSLPLLSFFIDLVYNICIKRQFPLRSFEWRSMDTIAFRRW